MMKPSDIQCGSWWRRLLGAIVEYSSNCNVACSQAGMFKDDQPNAYYRRDSMHWDTECRKCGKRVRATCHLSSSGRVHADKVTVEEIGK